MYRFVKAGMINGHSYPAHIRFEDKDEEQRNRIRIIAEVCEGSEQLVADLVDLANRCASQN